MGIARLERDKAGWQAGLQREGGQQPLRKGMERLHGKTARHVERAGKKAARLAERPGVRRNAQRQQFGGKTGVVGDRPAAEVAHHPILHFGRRRLGEGQRQDAFRGIPGQQQPQHAIGQHMSLAGAGRGRHPDMARRIGGDALLGGAVQRPSHSATLAR